MESASDKSQTTEESFGKSAPAIEVARWIKAYAAWFPEADASGHTEINDAFRAGYIHGCSDAMSEIGRLRGIIRELRAVHVSMGDLFISTRGEIQ